MTNADIVSPLGAKLSEWLQEESVQYPFKIQWPQSKRLSSYREYLFVAHSDSLAEKPVYVMIKKITPEHGSISISRELGPKYKIYNDFLKDKVGSKIHSDLKRMTDQLGIGLVATTLPNRPASIGFMTLFSQDTVTKKSFFKGIDTIIFASNRWKEIVGNRL